MTAISAIHRYVDPGDTLGEVLFGLIMALTIISGAEIFSAPSELDAHQLVLAEYLQRNPNSILTGNH